MVDTIILVEGENDLIKLKEEILTSKYDKIISFDFLSHNSLKKLGIPHNIIEEYFLINDQIEIDNKSVELTTQWYKHKDLSELLEYNGFKLGSLVELEICQYFLLHLKRIMGILNMIEKENPTKLIGSSLGNFIHSASENKNIEKITKDVRNTYKMYHDSVEIPLNIGEKLISIKISKKSFLFIKKISEIFTSYFFNVNMNLKTTTKKNILLLDFNPVIYSDLLKSLSTTSENIILLNQRRPAIWNLESLKIIKNFNCRIIQLEQLITPELAKKINKEIQILRNKLDLLWSKEMVLKDVFSIRGHSFWNAIKDEFKNMISKRFEEGIRSYLLIQNLFETTNFSCILEWAHVGAEEKIVINVANEKNIPIILLQHALYPLNTKFDKYLPIFPYLPSDGVKEAVWGNLMKEYLLEKGVDQKDIILVGSPRHDSFFSRQNNSRQNNNTILIAFNGLFYNNYNGLDTLTYDYYEDCIKRIFQIVGKISNKKIIVKLHPAKQNFDVKPLIRAIDPSIPIYQNQNIINFIESCDIMISIGYSTSLLDAMILNKPTILILIDKQNFECETLVKNKATICVSNIDEFESSLNDLLFNNNTRRDIIQNAREFIENYLSNKGTASEHLAQLLKKY